MISGLKPYPAYKDSGTPWLAEVPAHWDVLPAFAAYYPKLTKNTGMAERTVLSLSYGRIIVKPEEKLRGLVPESFETYQIVEPGDIVVRTTDLQNDQTSLRVGLVSNRGIITSAYLCLGARSKIYSKFGYQLLNSYDLLKILYGFGSGLRQNLDFKQIKRMPVLVPPLEEQSAIVRFLDHADRRIGRYIRAKKKLIALLNEQKQAIIHQVVTRGLDPNVRLKPAGVEWLGEVPEHWEVWQIGHLGRVGNGATPSRSNPDYWSRGSFPWLNSSSVNRGQIDYADQFVTDLALRECHLPRVKPGSVLVAITGAGRTRGLAASLNIEATINQHIAYITPLQSKVYPDFLCLALTGAYQELRTMSDDSGSTKGALTCSDIAHFRVPLPPLGEQFSIVTAVQRETRNAELSVEWISREIQLLNEYRTRLIADVVTGKLDVREAAARLPEEPGEPGPLGGDPSEIDGEDAELDALSEEAET